MENIEEQKEPPKKWFKNIIKWANASKGVIAAMAALVTALGAFFKPPDHSVTKTAYDTISVGMKQIADEQRLDHDDIVKLRGYLEGLAHDSFSTKISASLLSVESPKVVRPKIIHKPVVVAPHPPVMDTEPPEPVSESAAEEEKPPQMQELPPVHDKMERMELPTFEGLTVKK
jgi:hypothetical protein